MAAQWRCSGKNVAMFPKENSNSFTSIHLCLENAALVQFGTISKTLKIICDFETNTCDQTHVFIVWIPTPLCKEGGRVQTSQN